MRVVLDPIKLRAALESAGMSQSELARQMGWPPGHVNRLCRVPDDPYDMPNVELSTLGLLITHLKLVSVDHLLRYLPEPDDAAAAVKIEPTGPAGPPPAPPEELPAELPAAPADPSAP